MYYRCTNITEHVTCLRLLREAAHALQDLLVAQDRRAVAQEHLILYNLLYYTS